MLVSVLISWALCAQAAAPIPIESPAPAPCLSLDAPPYTARFATPDEPINAAWQRAVSAIEIRRAGGFAAELSTSAGSFWGDLGITGRAYLWHTGDPAVLRAGIERVLHPSTVTNGAEEHTPLAVYPLTWPYLLRTYYLHTGDAVWSRAMAGFALPELSARFAAARTAEGLLDPSKLAAWPEELRAGFSSEAAAQPNAPLNAFYFHALTYMTVLAEEFGLPSEEFSKAAAALRKNFEIAFWDEAAGLYRDAAGIDGHSVLSNAMAIYAGLAPADRHSAIVALIRRDGANCADAFRPYVIEACFKAGEAQLALDLLSGEAAPDDVSMLYLVPEQVAGLLPAAYGWNGAQIVPRVPPRLEEFSLSVPIAPGRASLHYARDTGARLLLPPGLGAWVEAGSGGPIMVKNEISHGRGAISRAQLELLKSKDWDARAGEGIGVWVSIADQMLRVVEKGQLLYQARCASSAAGIGSEMNSMKTPLGWHKIVSRLGANAVRGQVFRSRQPTREVWQPGEQPAEDLVLTRVLLLDGLEPGLNKGGNVDSYDRNIYIHGTNDEARLGTPSSHGCIRLSNDDVIEVFEILSEGAPVLITAE